MKLLNVTTDHFIESALVIGLFLLMGYVVYDDLTSPPGPPSACSTDPESEDCYYEEMNNEYDQWEDAQCGGACRY